MSKIPVMAILEDFQRMLKERWAYGSETKTGQVDCSGAFVWSYQQHGRYIYHGSNRMARVEVEKLIPINVANIVPGMAAFKCRKPGDTGYALPSSYQKGGAYFNGDLNDYYHVGLIDEDTTRVLNAQGSATGFVASPIGQNWSHVAYLEQVDYGMGDQDDQAKEAFGVATVYAANGEPVKLRKTASIALPYLEKVPVGESVTLRGPDVGGWTPVQWNGKNGYMMSKFLLASGDQTGDAANDSCSSYAVEFYDLTYEQAVNLQSEIQEYNSRIEGRNG